MREEFDLSLLNDEQREATTAKEQRILCLAGAGTGKTRTLVSRIQRLLEDGVSPESILCLTFTRLAGLEMKERIGEKGKGIFINTFHSFCYHVIEKNLQYFKVQENFLVLNDEEKNLLMEKVIADLKIDVKPEIVEAYLSSVESLPQTKMVKEAELVAKEYRYRLMLENALDINSLLCDVVKAFKEHEDLREKYHNMFKYVFIDEYQDTDDKQMSFIRNINPENLFLVGDDYQSIYGFRGTKVEYILNLSKDPTYKQYELKQNYRSTKEIIAAAEKLIAHNDTKTEKTLITHKKGVPVRLEEFQTEDEEFEFVMKTITESGRPYSDFTVISRVNHIVERLQDRMEKVGIPSRILGRKMAVLESTNTRKYLLLLEAIRNLSSERIASSLIDVFYSKEESENIRLEALGKGMTLEDVLLEMGDDLSNLLFEAAMEEPLKMDVVNGHIHLLAKDFVLNQLDSFELNQLHTFMIQWKRAMTSLEESEDVTLMGFMNWMKTKDDADIEFVQRQNYGDVVRLTTAHSSKGLEFPIVFMIGMNDGVFPILKVSKRSFIDSMMDKKREKLTGKVQDFEKEHMEEERRLAFVAITRAKEELILTRPKTVKRKWDGADVSMSPSRFLKEIGL